MAQHSMSTRRDGVVLCQLGQVGQPFTAFSRKEFTADAITCDACLTRIAARQARHAQVMEQSTSNRPSLLSQIKADMVKRNPSVAIPEWATE